ncbi:hypothetical protein [Azoarcus olearius]|uniref:Uncharacterized protein n=1 Tax=Azoarcus sp. (strain BH72) TaxID=418699 RepID=A1K8C1_AZOSB|nr:hypothetical protein [Azoarcus olearius]CAL95076.1 Hypothetical protein azo2459 [Azoarcus olearius]
MNDPFDTDLMDEAAATDDALLGDYAGEALSGFDEAGSDYGGDEAEVDLFGDGTPGADPFAGDSASDGSDAMADEAEGADDTALWDAFEDEIADGLDAGDDDEFLGRLLGGLGRAASVVGRGVGTAGAGAGAVRNIARRAGAVAGQVGRVAGTVSPAAAAAARLARMLGAPGAAAALGQAGRVAQGVGRAAGHARGLSGSLGQAAGGAQGLFGQLSQLLGQNLGADDAFDAVADLYLEDGVDEALPAAVALAARAAARGLGFRNVAQLTHAGRRALVRGVASAARELVRARGPQAVRALPGLARSAARVAQRRVATPQQAAQVVRRGLPQTARRVARNPGMVRRLAQQRPPAPLSRPTHLGHGIPSARLVPGRRYHISGPATLTITPR